MSRDPHNPFDDRAAGLAMMGCVFFCTATGAGVGVFVEEPAIGAMAGLAAGILLGLWLVPRLMHDWRD